MPVDAAAASPAALQVMASTWLKQPVHMAAHCTGDTVAAPMATVGIRLPLIVASASAVVAATAVAAARTPPEAWERAAARGAYDLPSWLTPVLSTLMQAGTRPAIIVGAAAAHVVSKRLATSTAVLISGASAWLTATVLKDVFDRSRPSAALLGRAVRDAVAGNGLPSSHAAIAAALAVSMVLLVRLPTAASIALLVVAVLTAVARAHLGVHWPLDAVAGAAIGTACSGVVAGVARGSRLQT